MFVQTVCQGGERADRDEAGWLAKTFFVGSSCKVLGQSDIDS